MADTYTERAPFADGDSEGWRDLSKVIKFTVEDEDV